MSASSRTIQQPAFGGSISTAIAMAAVVLVAALAIAWGTANLTGTTSVAVSGRAPVVLARDTDASRGAAATQIGATHGAPGAYRPVAGSTSADRLKDDTLVGSNQGAPAPRHAGPRAQ